jgi:hypothetical protein
VKTEVIFCSLLKLSTMVLFELIAFLARTDSPTTIVEQVVARVYMIEITKTVSTNPTR